MQKITPHIWFDTQAIEASKFYTSLFPDSKIKSQVAVEGTPSNTIDIITLDLFNFEFTFLNAGPAFTPNPSISFMILCENEEEVDKYWKGLEKDSKVLMPLDKYDFSEKYGWIEDKYGVSWQIILHGEPVEQKVIPAFLFVKELCGKAKESAEFYTSIFKNSEIVSMYPYGPEQKQNDPEHIMYGDFKLEGQLFATMDSGLEHDFSFNEGISLIVNCENQEEIDYYWEKLSADPDSEQCGWMKDKYGVTWQIVPIQITKLYETGDKKRIAQMNELLMEMKKLDLKQLEDAYKK